MASAGQGPGGPQPTPQQLQQIAQMQAAMAAEAQKRGMTPQEFQEQQRKALEAEAAKRGISPQEYVNQLRQQAFQQQQMQQRMQQQGQQTQQPGEGQQQQGQPQSQPQGAQQVQQQIPINPNMQAAPEALAVAKFLRGQNLKTRTCILDGQRKDMFKGTTNDAVVLFLLTFDSYSKTSSACSAISRVSKSSQQEELIAAGSRR